MMTRAEFVLAVLSTAKRRSFTPVQLQKLFFILDREVPDDIEGPRFEFAPYHYGPFDQAVYREIESLEREGFIDCRRIGGSKFRVYSTTPEGEARGEELFAEFDGATQGYIGRVSDFVRNCEFAELVSVIYKEYPDMKENSVFQ